MIEMCISDREYDKLIKRLEFYGVMRNNLLTFSFTSVLAVLGIALAKDDMSSEYAWICLIPFFLIIPFSARIAYYRLASTHINSFLKRFDECNMQFEIGTNIVTERMGSCKSYGVIAWLVNHEMFFLSIATSVTFYFEYIPSVEHWRYFNYISLIIPLILIGAVFIITNSTFCYKNLMDSFTMAWDEYAR